jgi:hypothetical protein
MTTTLTATTTTKQQQRRQWHRHSAGRPLHQSDSATHYACSGSAASACSEAAMATPPVYRWQHHCENVFMFSIWTYFIFLQVSIGFFWV